MIIDNIIEHMEKLENKLRNDATLSDEIRNDSFIKFSFFIHLVQLGDEGGPFGGNQNFIQKIHFLDDEINRLILIVRRLRDTATLPLLRLHNTKTQAYAEIDAESFFHTTYLILTQIARLNRHFFKGIKSFPSNSFDRQKKFFTKPDNINIDKQYSKYLNERMYWYDAFREYRTCITHYHPPVFIPDKIGLQLGIKIKKGQGYNFLDIPEYIDETSNQLLEFIIFYNNHFSKKYKSK